MIYNDFNGISLSALGLPSDDSYSRGIGRICKEDGKTIGQKSSNI